MIDLIAEWEAYARAFSSKVADALHGRYGVLADAALAAPGAGFGFARIITHHDGTFQPSPEGTGALILISDLCDDEAGIADLVAFRPSEPGCCWTRLGLANWLAGWEVDRRTMAGIVAPTIAPALAADARFTDKHPLYLWRTPLGWMRGGCIGAVPLGRAAFLDLSAVEAPIAVEDLAHADEVERVLRRPVRLPRLVVPTINAKVAA